MRVEIELTEPFTDGGRFDAHQVQESKKERILDVLQALGHLVERAWEVLDDAPDS